MKRYHPDRVGSERSGFFQQIVEAYHVLADPERRKNYDRGLYDANIKSGTPPAPIQMGAGGTGELPQALTVLRTLSFKDAPFEAALARVSGSLTAAEIVSKEYCEGLNATVTLSAAEAHQGGIISLAVPSCSPCALCGGSGQDGMFPCAQCDGEGLIGGSGASGFSDFFETLFGGRRGGRGRPGAGFGMRGQDVEAELPLTLEEAHRGGRRNITLQMTEPCPDCRGSGTKDGKTVCPTCRGTGGVRRPKSLEVNIPPGVRDGSVIRLAGQGEPGTNGAAAGDLFLGVRLQPGRLGTIIDELFGKARPQAAENILNNRARIVPSG